MKRFWQILILIGCFALGGLFNFCMFYFFPKDGKTLTNINKLEKEVTVTDTGIADAVDKIYNATVVIISSVNNTPKSSGSGFVFKTDDSYAYIITNNHVVSNGDAFSATFTNDIMVKAELVGGDQFADIAVLKVDKDKILSTAEIGNTNDIRLGDTVFAVGAPLDSSAYAFSVTRGILSGKDRYVEVSLSSSIQSDWVMKVLQTDAAINSGNSGGPLVNSNGEVIGVTNMKLASSGVEGMGFAITIEDAVKAANNIIEGTIEEKPYLGINMYNAAYAYYGYIKNIKTTESSGVYISDVENNSSADKAGLMAGDVIVAFNNHEISNVAKLRYYLYQEKLGTKVNIKIIRDSKEKTIELKLDAK